MKMSYPKEDVLKFLHDDQRGWKILLFQWERGDTV